nr:MAG TPA: hypothetical protein [Caudoviricetes sp.]
MLIFFVRFSYFHTFAKYITELCMQIYRIILYKQIILQINSVFN